MGRKAIGRKAILALLVISSALTIQVYAKQPNAELQKLDDALPGTLINDPSKLDWPVFGPGVSSKPIKDTNIPGGGALQITSPTKSANIYDIGANAPITSAVEPGQKLVVAFYARTIKADTPDGKGKLGIRVQQNATPYPGFGDTVLNIGPEWKLYEVKAESNIAIAKGLGVVNFQFSGANQTIQIGQTIIVEGADSIIPTSPGQTAAAKAAPLALMLPQLEGKGTLINDPGNQANWGFYGDSLTKKSVPAGMMASGSAISVNIAAVGTNAYDDGVIVPINGDITEGDVLTLAFLARTVDADTADGTGKIGLRVQRNVEPYPGFGNNSLAIGPNWKLYQLRTQAKMDIAKGQAVVSLQLSAARQEVELGPFYVLNAGRPAPSSPTPAPAQ